MPVGWALVGSEKEPVNLPNIRNLKNLAVQAGKPWAQAVQFTVHHPLTKFFHSPPEKTRKWNAVVEIDGVSKPVLLDVLAFIEEKCSHSDGLG